MSENQTSTSSPRELFGLIFRHKKKIGVFCLLTLSVAFGIIIYYPRSYVSAAKLYVRVGREIATLDPTATTGETVSIRIDQVKEINSLLDILESRGIAERVVDIVGVERVLAGGGTPGSSTTSSKFSPAELIGSFRSSLKRLKALVSEPLSDREIAVTRVEKMTEVQAPRESTVITIGCKAGSPELAQEIALAMTDVFLKEHLRLNRTKGTHEFFAEQSRLLYEQLAEASRELAARKSDFQLLSIEGKREIIGEEFKTVRLELLIGERALTASHAKVRNLEETVASVSPQITETTTGFSRDAWNAMRDKLYGVEIVASEFRSKYTDAHPQIAAVTDQHRRLSKILEGQPQDRMEVDSIPNPLHQSLEAELLTEKTKVSSLEATREILAQQHAKVVEDLEQLNDQEYQIATLQRQVELLDSSYRTHTKKMEEARIYDALEVEKISSINIAQQATFEGKPVSPRNRLVLLSAVVVSMFGGLALALLAESLNQTRSTPGKAEVVLNEQNNHRRGWLRRRAATLN